MVSDEVKTLVHLIVSEDLMHIFINVTDASLVNSIIRDKIFYRLLL